MALYKTAQMYGGDALNSLGSNMHCSKIACLAAALLCLVYSGACDVLQDGIFRVQTEIDPVTYKIDNDVAVGNNILGGISSVNGDVNAVTSTAQAAFSAVAQPYLDAVQTLNTLLNPTAAASCVVGAAEQITAAALNAAIGYINCVTPVVSVVPGQLTSFQGIVTRRNDPSIVNIVSSLVSLVQQFIGLALQLLVGSINSAINSAESLLSGIVTDLASVFSQAVQSAVSIATCAVNVKLAEIAAAVNVVNGIVACATNLGVAVTPPVLPPEPEDVTSIVNGAVASFNNFASQIASLAANIASAARAVAAVASQIAAVTADVIFSAISAVVQPYITKLSSLKLVYFLNLAAVADIQAYIDKLVIVQNYGVTTTTQLFNQLSQQTASLNQTCTSLDSDLKGHVRNKGVSGITACANNVAKNNPNYVKVCSNTLVKNTPLVLSKIQGDVDVVNAASGNLNAVSDGALNGQAAITGNQAGKVFNDCKTTLKTKYNIKV